MTYILGVSVNGVNSIISDTRVSYTGNKEPENTTVKTGVLFDGCIYGMAGNIDHALDFIRYAQMRVSGSSNISDSWNDLNDFINSYDFPTGKNSLFQLLLSSRHPGQPEFHLLSSDRNLVQCKDDFVSIGYSNARDFLDPIVREHYFNLIDEAMEKLKEIEIPNKELIYPYFLSLGLSEKALTFQCKILEEAKVGGIFNFVFQSNTNEGFQEPALYIFADANRDSKSVKLYGYRICRIPEGLYIESNDKTLFPGVLGDNYEALLTDRLKISPEKIRGNFDLKREIILRARSLPYYWFCGFGYTQPEYQYGHECHVRVDMSQDNLLFNSAGEISEEFTNLVKKHILRRPDLPGKGEGVAIRVEYNQKS